MSLPPPSIKTRPQFDEELDQAIALCAGCLGSTPGWPAMQVIGRQLDAMRQWTAGGRTPTKEERDKISIGVIAVRELDDDDYFNLAELLHRLNYFFTEWPLP